MFVRIIGLCLLITLSYAALQAADLHVIAVGDLAAKDLKSGIEADLENVEECAHTIADNTGMTLRYHSFTAKRRLPHTVLKYIQDLQTNEDDVLIFYYSGHGYRTPGKKGSPWPNMYFTGDVAGLELDLVSRLLSEKSAHLVIVMADCCNSMLMDYLAPPLVKEIQLPDNALKVANYNKLFTDYQGLITIASSKAGQVSYSVDNYGGLYTNAFLKTFDALITAVPTSELDWPLILETSIYVTSEYTQNWGIIQDPIYQIDVSPRGSQ